MYSFPSILTVSTETRNRYHTSIWIQPYTAITVLRFYCDFSVLLYHPAKSDSHLTPNTPNKSTGYYTLLVWNSYKSLARAH